MERHVPCLKRKFGLRYVEAASLPPCRGEAAVLSKFRRDAAVLAAYLAQFENTDTNPGTGTLPLRHSRPENVNSVDATTPTASPE